MGESLLAHSDHIAAKRRQFITALQFGSQIFLPRAIKIPAAKAAVDKE